MDLYFINCDPSLTFLIVRITIARIPDLYATLCRLGEAIFNALFEFGPSHPSNMRTSTKMVNYSDEDSRH